MTALTLKFEEIKTKFYELIEALKEKGLPCYLARVDLRDKDGDGFILGEAVPKECPECYPECDDPLVYPETVVVFAGDYYLVWDSITTPEPTIVKSLKDDPEQGFFVKPTDVPQEVLEELLRNIEAILEAL